MLQIILHIFINNKIIINKGYFLNKWSSITKCLENFLKYFFQILTELMIKTKIKIGIK